MRRKCIFVIWGQNSSAATIFGCLSPQSYRCIGRQILSFRGILGYKNLNQVYQRVGLYLLESSFRRYFLAFFEKCFIKLFLLHHVLNIVEHLERPECLKK